jgi:hypothetical protein
LARLNDGTLRAQLAREILDKLRGNQRFRDALVMLDWTGREFEIEPGRREEIRWEDLVDALRPWQEPMSFTEKEIYIRDCFDELFDGFNLLEHYLRTDLVEFSDIEFPLSYYIVQLRTRWDAVSPFINHYGNTLALALVQRFPAPPSLTSVEGRIQETPAQQTRLDPRSESTV